MKVQFGADVITYDEKKVGTVKEVVLDPATKEILGAHIVGENASDLIAPFALCMNMEGTLEEIAETVFVHPTFSEGVMEAAEMGLGQGVHFG